jgi:hypothetical protein
MRDEKESLLKKEFKESDLQRARNLVNKDFTGSTKTQTGYQKSYVRRIEGDVWNEGGKSWTIKNGLKQNITKLDAAKKAIRIPLACPQCKGKMTHWLAKKMYKIHGVCFNCTVENEQALKKAGLYDQYEKRMMQGNMRAFAQDIQDWSVDFVNESQDVVTEDGVIEDWNSNSSAKKQVIKNVKDYLDILNKHIV